jgi:anti-sigma factor RsiW
MDPNPMQLPERQGRRLSAWLDGEGRSRRRRLIASTLERDPAALEEIEAWRAIDRLLDARPDPQDLGDLRAAVLARVRADRPRGRRAAWSSTFSWSRPVWALGWALAGMMVGLWLGVNLKTWSAARAASQRDYQEVAISMMMPAETATLTRVVASTEGPMEDQR